MSRTNEPIWSDADHANGDEGHDNVSNCQEYRCGTDPTTALSYLKTTDTAPTGIAATARLPPGAQGRARGGLGRWPKQACQTRSVPIYWPQACDAE